MVGRVRRAGPEIRKAAGHGLPAANVLLRNIPLLPGPDPFETGALCSPPRRGNIVSRYPSDWDLASSIFSRMSSAVHLAASRPKSMHLCIPEFTDRANSCDFTATCARVIRNGSHDGGSGAGARQYTAVAKPAKYTINRRTSLVLQPILRLSHYPSRHPIGRPRNRLRHLFNTYERKPEVQTAKRTVPAGG